MFPIYRLTSEKCNFWPHSVTGPPDVPPYRLTGEKCSFWPYFVNGPPNGSLYKLTREQCSFCHILSFNHQMFPHTGEKFSFGPTFRVGQQMVNLSFKIGGGLNGPLPFAGSL